MASGHQTVFCGEGQGQKRRVSEARVSTALSLSASDRHRVQAWLTQAMWLPLAEKQTPCTQLQLLLDLNISSSKGILGSRWVGAGRSSTSLM